MAPSKKTWTKPVTTKLRKRNIAEISKVQHQSLRSTKSLDNVSNNEYDSWSLPSDPQSAAEDFEEVSQYIESSPDESAESFTHASQSSSNSGWSFIDVGVSQSQQEADGNDSPAPPHIVVETPSTPSYHGETGGSPNLSKLQSTRNEPSDYRGARSYWTDRPDLDAVAQQIRDLRESQRLLRRASREHFKAQETQLSQLKNARWEVEASRDEIEKRIDALKTLQAQGNCLDYRLNDAENTSQRRTYRSENDKWTIDLHFAPVNARERAIFDHRGKQAQLDRGVNTPRNSQPIIQHPTHNRAGDFPYKEGTFIHRDVPGVYTEEGIRIGWMHKHMPSYKKAQLAALAKSKGGALLEMGKLPATERRNALGGTEGISQMIAAGKGRRMDAKWYTGREMQELIEKRTEDGDQIRHDSMTGPS